jgi:hypothetical protein
MTDYDQMQVSIAIQDYVTQANNYHFYNDELARMEHCEKVIKSVAEKYQDNLQVLEEIYTRLDGIKYYKPKSLMKEIEDLARVLKSNTMYFYSLDGQQFTNIDDAIARNEMLQKSIEDKGVDRPR